MSMTIHFEVGDDAGLVRYMASLGFYRKNAVEVAFNKNLADALDRAADKLVDETDDGGAFLSVSDLVAEIKTQTATEAPVNLAGPARIPGQPSEGRKRRTRAEVVEDEAYFAAHPNELKNLKNAGEGYAAISTGEERVDPEAAAQDAADEAAESAAHRTGELTTEDLRDVIGQYSQQHGIAAAQADIPKLLGGKGIYEIDKTQAALKIAIDAVRAALDGKQTMTPPGDDLFGGDKPTEEVHATKDDVMEAIKSYAKKYDGQDTDLSKAANVLADIPVVLEKTLGVKQIKQIPADPVSYGKALRAINEAVNGNPFGRMVVK